MVGGKYIFAAVLLALASEAAAGRFLLQNGLNTTIRWAVPSNGKYDPVNVPVGATVNFTWTSTHDLWEIPSSSCPTTFANGTNITQLAARSSGGERAITYTTAGTHYYACSVGDHCASGQLVLVRVGSFRAPAPAPGASSSTKTAPQTSTGTSGSGYGGGGEGYGGGGSSNYGTSSGVGR